MLFYDFLKQIPVTSDLKVPFQKYFLNFMNRYSLTDMLDMGGYFMWLKSQFKYYKKHLKENPNDSFEDYQEELETFEKEYEEYLKNKT